MPCCQVFIFGDEISPEPAFIKAEHNETFPQKISMEIATDRCLKYFGGFDLKNFQSCELKQLKYMSKIASYSWIVLSTHDSTSASKFIVGLPFTLNGTDEHTKYKKPKG